MSLTDVSKRICVIWDFPDLDTRFVTRNHAGLDQTIGTIFEGAKSTPSSGAKFDLTRAQLELGDSQFQIPDVNQTITAWLATNDTQLSQVRVVKRQGLIDEAESDYVSSYWLLDDYQVDTRAGGGYKFYLTNTFKKFNNAVYEDYDSESYRLFSQDEQGGLEYTDTDFVLDGVEDDAVFQVPGFFLFSDEVTKEQELIRYTSKTGNRFSGLTRRYWGVGASNPTTKNFTKENTTIYPVWVRRGGPIELMLQWAMTTSNPKLTGGSDNRVTNGDLDDWTGGNPDNFSWSGTSITEETEIVRTDGGSSVKGSANAANFVLTSNNFSNCKPDEWQAFTAWIRIPNINASETVTISIKNVTQNTYWSHANQDWSGTETEILTINRFNTWLSIFYAFLPDSGYSAADNYTVEIKLTTQTGALIYVDDIVVRGGTASPQNGPYDQNDGDGVGVPYDLFNLWQIEEVQDFYWPRPIFDASNGNKLSGTGVLFVENEPIDDLKEWCENHIFLPFGLKPLVDETHRLVLDRYYNYDPNETTIGDKWDKAKFNAGKWRRNFSKSINNFTLMTDFSVGEGKLVHSYQFDHDPAIDAYGRSKPLKLECRGGRTGRFGFPQYDSISDCEVAAARIALEVSNPWSQLELEVFYEFRDLSQLDAVILNVPVIPDLVNGVRGLVGARFFIDSVKIDEKKGVIVLTIRERREPYKRPALIGISGLPDYGAASDAQKIYAYIGDQLNNFSDGGVQYVVA